MTEGVTWIVTQSTRLPNGHLEVTYSVASGQRYTVEVIPGVDAAAAIHAMGEHIYATWKERGYL